MEKRPHLDKEISLTDFKEFYWLKEELVKFCREEKLKTTGGKIEIAQRIEHYIKTGEKQIEEPRLKRVKKSKFDWNNEELTTETRITDNYKNTENVRIFFVEQIGNRFKFNVKFMNWMKSNAGKTLEQAIEKWKTIDLENKRNTKPKEIAPQFEYNTYLRDFLTDNPGQNRDTGIKLWKIKRSMRGDNIYKKSDLDFIENK